MASLFSALASSARAAHAHYFSETAPATLTEGGVQKQVTVVLGKSRVESRREDDKWTRVSIRDCRLIGLTSVRHDATVLAGGILYSIDMLVDMQASHVTATLRRITACQINRPNYRGKS